MRLWRNIRRVLWAMGITTVLILATVECFYRAALTHLPLLPPHMNGATVPVLLARATWAAEEGSMVVQVRRLVPWALLRVLTRILRARRGHAASSEKQRLPRPAEMEWTLKVEELSTFGSMAPSRSPSALRRLSLLEGDDGLGSLRACAASPRQPSAGGARRSCPFRAGGVPPRRPAPASS